MTSAQQSVDEPAQAEGESQTKLRSRLGMTRDLEHWGYIIPSFCAGIVATALVLEVALLMDAVSVITNYSTILIVLITLVALAGNRIG